MTRGRSSFLVMGALAVLAACDGSEVKVAASAPTDAPRVTAASDIDAGRYLVRISGCNDCHTPGYVQGGGVMPEAEWLKGNSVGFYGPWGTTYAHNLRLTTANMTEDAWVEMLGTRKALPIMPWPSVNAMSDDDKRAIYRFIRSLGTAGAAAPTALPPGVTPTGPHENLNVVTP